MAQDEAGALWHFEGHFGTSRVLVRMVECDGRWGIRVRVDRDGHAPERMTLTLEQAAFLVATRPSLEPLLRSWQEQRVWERSLRDPFVDFDSADRGDGHEMDRSPGRPVVQCGGHRRRPDLAAPRPGMERGRGGAAGCSASGGAGVEQLARLLQRSPRAVRKRLEKLELVGAAE